MEYGFVIEKLGELQMRFEQRLVALDGDQLANKNTPPYLLGRIKEEIYECKSDVALNRLDEATIEADDIVIFYSSLMWKVFVDMLKQMLQDLSFYEQETEWMRVMSIPPTVFLDYLETTLQDIIPLLEKNNIEEAQHKLLFAGAIIKQLFFSLRVRDVASILVSALEKQDINEAKYTPDILIRAQTVGQGMKVCKDVWNVLVQEIGSPELVVVALLMRDKVVLARREELVQGFLMTTVVPKASRLPKRIVPPTPQPAAGYQQAV